MKLSETASFLGSHGPDTSGCSEVCWDSDPAFSARASVGPFAVDSSGFADFWCSYVEHSFLLTNTTSAGGKGRAVR